ncbi:MAG: diguanylate cyclase (GGDEF)-like protein [Candidatus Omnitrophota bacterium]|jgi:diguanylate cyclase (GGDEF)-like protein
MAKDPTNRILVSIDKNVIVHLPKSSYEILDQRGLRYRYEPHDIAKLEKRVFDFFTLSQLGKSLLSIQQMDELCHVFLSSVHETTGSSNCTIFLYDERDEFFKCAKGIGLDPSIAKDIKFKKEEGLFWQILNSGEPFPIVDTFGVYRFESIVKQWELHKIDSQVWVPLIVKEKLIGILTLGRKQDGSVYQDVELNFILQLGNQAAVAFESAMLDEQKERASKELAKKMENLSILYSVSKALNFATDLKKILLFILDKSRDAVNAQKASLMLLDKATGELAVHVVRGVPPEVEQKINSGKMDCKKIAVGEGIAGRVVETREHILVNNVSKDERFKKDGQTFADNILCMPLVANDEAIGVINLTNKQDGSDFTSEDAEILSTLSNQAAITIYNARLYHLAITDGMTQLRIHRYFQQRLDEEIKRAAQFNHPLSLIMSDIDHFKNFNDTYGHQQGDIVLIETAKLFGECIREVDIAARYGGEEFAIILPETDIEEAEKVAEKIRKTIEEHDYTSKKGVLKVTASLGVSTFPQHGKTKEQIIEAADKAMYVAKEAGRNNVKVAK